MKEQTLNVSVHNVQFELINALFKMSVTSYPTLHIVGSSLDDEFKKFSKIVINKSEFTLGRGLNNSVVIEWLSLSRKHCIFRKKENTQWTLEDTSAFGILLNKVKIKKGTEYDLSDDDIIQLDPNKVFVYKYFCNAKLENEYLDSIAPPCKKLKLCEDLDLAIVSKDMMTQKFDESQHFEVQTLEHKIKTVQEMQSKSMVMKQQLQEAMESKIFELNNKFEKQIVNLNGEKHEVERQKLALELERDSKLKEMQDEMNSKICTLQNKITEHSNAEQRLTEENTVLKERLEQEREDFLTKLHQESASKQVLMEQLETKLKKLEEDREKEKLLMKETLAKKTELLVESKRKELKELEDKMKQHLEKRDEEAKKLRELEQIIHASNEEKERTEKRYQQKLEQLQRLADEDKLKMDQLLQEREEVEKKLLTAKQESSVVLSNDTNEPNKQVDEMNVIDLTEKFNNPGPSEKNNKPVDSHDGVRNEFGQLMESEFQCSICADLFITATTLNCSHTFCQYCIEEWRKKKNECPICRTFISSQCRSLVLDSFITKMVNNLSEEMKQRRGQILKEREEAEEALKVKKTVTLTESTVDLTGSPMMGGPSGRLTGRGRGRGTRRANGPTGRRPYTVAPVALWEVVPMTRARGTRVIIRRGRGGT